MYLDSLDQLDPDDGARQLSWLPENLPANVKMIVSTLPGEDYICFPILQALLPSNAFVEVPVLLESDANNIISNYMDIHKRALTSKQYWTVLKAFKACSLPLFLRVSLDEARRWKSYTKKEFVVLQSTIRGIRS